MRPGTQANIPWDLFQGRIKVAIAQAATHHQTVGSLLTDLHRCEVLLRGADDPIGALLTVDSPAADELRGALDDHFREDSVQFDGHCAANIVLTAMHAFVQEAARLDP